MADVIARMDADQSGDCAIVNIAPCLTDSATASRYINLFSDILMRLWILCRTLLIVVQQQKKLIFVDDVVEFSMHPSAAMRRHNNAGVTVDLIKMAVHTALIVESAMLFHQIMHGQCKFLP